VKERVVTHPRDVPFPSETRLGVAQAALAPRARVTARLKAAAGQAVGGRTVARAGRHHGLSWPVVASAFAEQATALLSEPEPVTVLGIDETRRGRPRFASNPQAGKLEQIADRWHTGFVDLGRRAGGCWGR
jgi:transposase